MIRSRFVTVFCLAALSSALWPATPAPLSQAWRDALQGAKASQMEKDFSRELEANPADALGAFGLAQAHLANGEREKAVTAAVEGLLKDAKSPAAFLLEEILSDEVFFDSATTKLVQDSLPIMLREEGMAPELRFNLRWLALRVAARLGGKAERASAQSASGFLNRAYFSVAKDDLARLDFLRVAGPEKGNYEGLDWKASSWDTPLTRPPLYETPDDREYNYYALAPFSVANDCEAILYFNGATSFAALVDGREVARKDNFRRQENPTAFERVSLKAGAHLLLLKVFASGDGEGVHVALLDDKGDALPAAFGADGAFSLPSTLAASKYLGPLTLRFERDFPKDDPRYGAFLGLFNRWLGDVARGRLQLEAAAAKTPRCLIWNLLEAQAYLFQADDLPAKIAQSRAERAVDAVTATDAECPLARYCVALMKSVNSDGDDDLPILKDLLDNFPGDCRWGLRLSSRLQQRGWIAEAREALNLVRSSHPESEEVESAMIGFAAALGDRQAQKEAIDRLGRLRHNYPEMEDYLEATLQVGPLESLIKNEIEQYGDRDLSYAMRLAKVEARAGESAAAVEQLRAILAADQENVDASLLMARELFRLGRDAEAFKVWDQLKKRRPRTFQVDLAHWVLGDPLPFESHHLTLEQVLSEDKADGPELAPSSLILDQQFTRIEPDGSSLERYHGVIRVNNKDGVDKEGEQSFRGQVVLSVRTVKPDGRVVEPELIPDKQTISMQGLEAGDLIEYEYLTFLPPNEIKPDSYITPEVFLFQDLEKPFHRTQWRLEYPASMGMRFYEQNLPHPAKSERQGDLLVKDWEYRAMPRLAPEPNTPYRTLFVPLVEAEGNVTWKDLGDFLKNRVTGTFQITPELEARYAEAVKGASTAAAKAEAIVSYVEKEIDTEDGGAWQDPTQTLMTRRGNRIPVACAFFELAAIPYKILFAEPVPNRLDRNDLPRMDQYTTPLIEVDLDPKRPAFYALQSSYRASTVLPWYLEGARALKVTDPEPWKVCVVPSDLRPWREASQEETRTLMPDGSLLVDHRQTLDPDSSESLRASLQRVGKDQWDKVLQVALSRQYGNADVTSYDVRDFDDADKPLGWNYSLKVQGFAVRDGNKLAVSEPLPRLNLSQSLASLKERTLPMTTGGFMFMDQTIIFKLPAGAKTSYAPPRLDLETPYGSYHLNTTCSGGVMTYSRKVSIPFQVIEPASYPAFADFLRKIDAAESGQMALELPPQ
ncbi:MAG: hypothetical protein JHC34_00235 [Acidobacteria bacterium]|nr:hypothetical protein [Acidobacteriota bacterium]